MDYYENAYSSGAHVAAGDEWLTIVTMDDGGSYFADYPEYDLRAYPAVYDLDGDGKLDLICGSSDGRLYFYKGKGYNSRMITEEAEALTDAEGRQLSVSSYSAPIICDYDGDGEYDIICGAGDGKVYLFRGLGEPQIRARGRSGEHRPLPAVMPDYGD